MGDNKISEELVSRACGAWLDESSKMRGGDHDCMRAALEAVFTHLQGEAVPVAHSEFALRALVAAGHVSQDKVDGALSIVASAHPQPAELNEVSGNSGELGVPKGWEVTPHTDPWRSGDRWEVYGPNGGGGVNESDIQCPTVRRLLDALAETGKQQVGEVQGSREQFEAWAKHRDVELTRWADGSYTDPTVNADWVAWQSAIASRQPVGVNGVDVEDVLHKAVDLARGGSSAIAVVGWITNELFDGRDAGTGVGDE